MLTSVPGAQEFINCHATVADSKNVSQEKLSSFSFHATDKVFRCPYQYSLTNELVITNYYLSTAKSWLLLRLYISKRYFSFKAIIDSN
jgi:hypothetical protein